MAVPDLIGRIEEAARLTGRSFEEVSMLLLDYWPNSDPTWADDLTPEDIARLVREPDWWSSVPAREF